MITEEGMHKKQKRDKDQIFYFRKTSTIEHLTINKNYKFNKSGEGKESKETNMKNTITTIKYQVLVNCRFTDNVSRIKPR